MKIRPSVLLASISALVSTVTTVRAVDYTWNTTTGDWANAANWINGVPTGGAGNFAIINNGGVADINATTNTLQDTILGRGAGNSGTVNLNSGTHTNTGWTIVGDGGTGTFNQSGGSQATGDMLLGISGGTGNYSLSGTGSATMSRMAIGGHRDVGAGGTGTVTINTTGTVTTTSDFWVGTRGANATLNVNAGTLNANTWFMVGETHQGGGSTGVVNQTGGVVSNAVANGSGRFWVGTQEGGATAASTGTYNLSGGTLNARNASIGRHYTGNFNHSGGIANFTQADDETTFATLAGSSSTYQLSGTGQVNFIGTAQIGARGTAVFNQTGGTVSANSWLGIGRFAGATGSVTVSGGTFTHNGNGSSIIVGEEGIGTLTVSGTGRVTENSTNGLRIAHGTGGNGTINVNSGGILETHFIQKTVTGNVAKLNFDGGTYRTLSNRTGGAAGAFIGLADSDIDIKAGGLNFDTNGFTVTLPNNLAGIGGLTKFGTGTLNIVGVPVYSGTTVVNAGTLSMGDGGTTGAVPGAVTVNSGGTFSFNRSDDLSDSRTFSGPGVVAQNGPNSLTLSGSYAAFTGSIEANAGRLIASGAFGGNVNTNNGGRLLPAGGAVGTISAAGLTIGTGSTVDFDFSAGGATYDQLVSSGGISFGAAFTLNLFQEGTANPFSTNGTYSLFDYATTVTGSPSGFTLGNAVLGKSYQLANNAGDTTVRMTIADAVLVEWANSTGALWSTNTNWTPNITPNVATADVTFGAAISAPATVDLNGNKTVGRLTFNNLNSYTIGGAGTLTLDNGLASASVTVASGSHSINTPMALTNTTAISTATGSSIQFSDLSGPAALTKSGDGTVIFNGTTPSGGLVASGGVIQAGNGGATGSFPSGGISLSNNTQLVFNSTGSGSVATVTGTGSLRQDAGSLTHSGTSNYNGSTDLNSGTFTNTGTLTGTSVIDVNNTANFNAGSTTSTTGNINVGPGGSVTSSGTISLATNLEINDGGSVTINAGSLTQTGTGNDQGIYVARNGMGTLNINAGNVSNYETRVGLNGGSVGNLNISGGTLATNHWTVVGENGGSNGTVTQTGGTWNQNHTDWLSVGQRGSGTYVMSGNAVLNDQAVVDTSNRGTNKGNVVVGRWQDGASGGNGTWTLNDNASARIRSLVVGDQPNTSGTVNVNNNATITSQDHDLFLANSGNGVINLNGGGAFFNQGWAFVGGNAGSNGQLNVAGGSTSSGRWYVGRAGAGVVTVSAGSFNANGFVLLGEQAGGSGVFTVSGGTATVAAEIYVASNATSSGTLNVFGGTLQQNGGATLIGDNGVGTGNFGGGTANLRRVIVGDGPGTNGSSFNMGGTAIVNSTGGAFTIGNGATANADVSGGTLTVDNEIYVGQAAGAVGTMSISGGTVSANSWIVIGRDTGNGTVTVSDSGILEKTGGTNTFIAVGAQNSTGLLTQTGGTVRTQGAGDVRVADNLNSTGTWNMSGGTALTDGIVVGGGGIGTMTISGTASINTGSFRVADGGTGTVTQSGGTVTVSGSLDGQVSGSGTYTLSGGRLNINGTAELADGTFNFTGGTLSRSNAGLIDINGPLTSNGASATLKLDANKTFDISGAFNNAGGLTLDLAGLAIPDAVGTGSPITGSFSLGVIGGAVSPANDAFDIALTSVSGFDNVFNLGSGDISALRINEDDAFNALTDSVYWIDEDAGIVTLQYSVVPEPSALAMIFGGVVLLARRRRRG